jgi:chlorobactene glucosyltransferase
VFNQFAVFIGLLFVVNLYFAARTFATAYRSRVAIEPCEVADDFPMLSIVVPARDEERQIECCVRSLLGQRYPNFEVIVVDDCSRDRTRAILDAIASEDQRLRVIAGAPLPAGWAGKPWALSQGIAQAKGVWLLGTDADTVHDVDAAGSAVAHAVRHRLGALSLITDQVLVSPAERMFLPSIIGTIGFGVGAFADINDPSKPDIAIFNGQFVLISRETYDAVGGYAAVRAEVAEDLELARLLKADGRFRIALVGSSGLVRTRMYQSFAEIWSGFVKNFALGVRGKPGTAAIAVVFLALLAPITPVAIVWAALIGATPAAWLLLVAMAVAMGASEYAMRQMRLPSGSGWTLPVGMSVTLAIFVTSLVRYSTGQGVEWRGRRYTG